MPIRKSPKRSVKRSLVKRRSKSPKVKRSVKRRSPKVKSRSVKRSSPKRSKSPKRAVKRRSVKRSVKRRSLKMRFTAEDIRNRQIALLEDKITDLNLEYIQLSREKQEEKREEYVAKFRSLARRIQDVYRAGGEYAPPLYTILHGWQLGSGDRRY